MTKTLDEQQQIRADRAKALGKIAKHDAKIGALHAQLKAIQARCKHPDRYHTTHMGEKCYHCPDCGLCP